MNMSFYCPTDTYYLIEMLFADIGDIRMAHLIWVVVENMLHDFFNRGFTAVALFAFAIF
jgi:hypothetical protein